MSMSDILDRACKRDGEDPAIVRLGHHAIELWRAAEEIGDPTLLAALRPLVEHVGRALARDVMDESCLDANGLDESGPDQCCPDDTLH